MKKITRKETKDVANALPSLNATPEERKAALEDFIQTLGMAELRALSNASLERPLTDVEFARMMLLKEQLLK